MNGPKFNDWYEKRYLDFREQQYALNAENRRRIDELLAKIAELKRQLEQLRSEIV